MFLEILIILITTYTIWHASNILGRETENLGNKYNIPNSVKGATLDAVGSSFPEFCTVIFCLYAGSFEAGLGTVAGSALYNILIIPSLCVIFTNKSMNVEKKVVYRDGIIYILTIIFLISMIYFGSPNPTNIEEKLINKSSGSVFILLYILYLVFLIFESKNSDSKINRTFNNQSLIKIISFIIISMIIIAISVHFLVDNSLKLFTTLGLSKTAIGVIILAATTSLPDTFLSIISAKRGDADAAISNALGSNTFDILICLGLPIVYFNGIYINWNESFILLIYLLISSVVSMILISSNWRLSKIEAKAMLIIYIIFFIYIIIQ